MTSIALDIPDEPSELPAWLEQQLVSDDLATLVAELRTVHGPRGGTSVGLKEFLGNHRDEVLAGGLGRLDPQQLRQLLVRPELLLELQELVLVEGGEYWDQAIRPSVAERRHAAHGERQLRQFIDGQSTSTTQATSATPTASSAASSAERAVIFYRGLALISLATAAAVLIGVFVQRHFFPDDRQIANPTVPKAGSTGDPKPNPSDTAVVIPKKQPSDLPPGEEPVKTVTTTQLAETWGWARPDAMAAADSREKYLTALAEEGGEWFKQRPDSPTTLAKRLLELRQGCSAMMFAEHASMTAADKEWLQNRCRGWAEKVSYELADLENGEQPLAVRGKVDMLIQEIQRELHARAAQKA